MKIVNFIFGAFLLSLTSLSLALEPLDTQIRSGGTEVNLIKTTVKDGILTVYVMVENQSDEDIEISNFDVREIQYIANGRRYPVLQDADNKWIISPFGASEIFYNHSYDSLDLDAGKSVIGWMKFEAPADDAWPIELNLPQTLPFLIEKPN